MQLPSPALQRFRSLGGGGWGRWITLPQNLMLSAGTLLEGFESQAEWTLSGAGLTKTDDATHVLSGASAIKMVSTTPGNQYMRHAISPARILTASDIIEVSIFVESNSSAPSLNMLMCKDASFSTGPATTWGALMPGWNTLRVTAAQMTGSDYVNAMAYIAFRLYTGADSTATVYIDNCRLNPSSVPAVCMSFDDGFVSQYSKAFAKMNPLGAKGTIYMTSNRAGTAGYCTTAQLQEMNAAGWDIANHGKDDAQLATLDAAGVAENVTTCRDFLVNNGMPRAALHLAYAGGSHDHTTTFEGLTTAGILSARTIYNQQFVYPPPGWYDLPCKQILSHTLAAVKGFVDETFNRQGVLMICFHEILDTIVDQYDWPTADFNALVDYIISKGMRFLTISELYAAASGPITHRI